jgi:ADP-ribose pyrophosphatase YjhB (NUDIX family)
MEKITYQGRIIEVVEQEVDLGGKSKTFEYARRSPGVRLIIPKDDGILLSKEFRHELQTYDYRLPGGKVYDSLEEYNAALAGGVDIAEAAKQAAIKEAAEEAGLKITDLAFFHKSVCGATVVWDLFYFVVNGFEQQEQNLEEGEDIAMEWVSREQAEKMCLDGSMSEERSALILLKYLKK